MPRSATLELPAFHRPGVDLAFLDQLFSEEKVWATIKSLPADRAPGPDGYNEIASRCYIGVRSLACS